MGGAAAAGGQSARTVLRAGGRSRCCTFQPAQMFLLATALTLVLHLGGIGGDLPHVYAGAGRAAALPCAAASSSTCSGTNWYFRRAGRSTTEVEFGKVVRRSARSSRMSLDPNCSLVLTNIAGEDAGLYQCTQEPYHFIFMSVLQISQHPDPQDKDNLRLECSVWRPAELGPCLPNSLRWLNKTGAVVGGNSTEGHQADVQADCSTFLAVSRQPDHSSKYRCQLLDEQNHVKVEEEYTPDTGSDLWIRIYCWSRIVGLVLLVGITVAVSRHGSEQPQISGDLSPGPALQ